MPTTHYACTFHFDGLAREIKTLVIITNIYNNKSQEYDAVWDTGATNSVISQLVVDSLELQPTDITSMQAVGSKPVESKIYDITVTLPNQVAIPKLEVVSAKILGNCNMLIGMDILTLGDFAITNYKNKTTATFSIPAHSKKIDFVERAVKLNKKKVK